MVILFKAIFSNDTVFLEPKKKLVRVPEYFWKWIVDENSSADEVSIFCSINLSKTIKRLLLPLWLFCSTECA